MNRDLYDTRPNRIVQRLEQLLKPLGYVMAFNNNGNLVSIKKGSKSKPCPYFYKDRKNRIHMKLKCHNNDVMDKCIDKESDEWLSYYAYREIVK